MGQSDSKSASLRTGNSKLSCDSASDEAVAVSLLPEEEEYDPSQVDALLGAPRSLVLRLVKDPRHELEGQAEQKLVDRLRKRVQAEAADLAPTTVLLNVYDLRDTLIRTNGMLAFGSENIAVGGAFHVGVELFGSEWSYGTGGVSCDPPRTCDKHVYRCSVVLGRTEVTQGDFADQVLDLCQAWLGDEYDVLGRNCCSFAKELCERLGVGPVPAWVDRLARLLDKGRSMGRSLLGVFKELTGGNVINDDLEEQSDDDRSSEDSSEEREPQIQQQRSSRPSLPGLAPRPNTMGLENAMLFSGPQGRGPGMPVMGDGPRGPGMPPVLPGGDHMMPGLGWPLMGEAPPFTPGTCVEYESVSQGRWVPATVLGFRPDTGLYDLDCKFGVPANRIRWPELLPGPHCGGMAPPGNMSGPPGGMQDWRCAERHVLGRPQHRASKQVLS